MTGLQKIGHVLTIVLKYLSLVFFAFVAVLPVVSCVITAFKTDTEYQNTNPLKVFEEVYGVISDRKVHPKEGSYTNYLFDKGIDKILKEIGEESAELIIAAKNPDPEEIKYEMSDLLYHAMVLMVERGVTWEEITKELANR